MADILHLVPIKAPPLAVFKAISEEQGLAAWWTVDVQAKAEEGSTAQFRFENGQIVMRMTIAELTSPERVLWQVAEPSPPEWEGTTISWDLEQTDEGTRLLFGHRGWRSTDGSFAAINYNWAYYLTSLKDYLETGDGFPHRT